MCNDSLHSNDGKEGPAISLLVALEWWLVLVSVGFALFGP